MAETRFGTVAVTTGHFAGAEVVHVARHGAGHTHLSSQVNHRANGSTTFHRRT